MQYLAISLILSFTNSNLMEAFRSFWSVNTALRYRGCGREWSALLADGLDDGGLPSHSTEIKYQDSPVVNRKAKKKQHVQAQLTQLPVCYLQLPTLKLPSTVTQSSWVLLLSYYRVITFLPCRISKLKTNELSATIVKSQPFQLLWCPFTYLRLKLDRLESNSAVTRELITFFM